MVGTSVRERMNDQIMANITASAIGTNRKRATPCRQNIGTNTMQRHSSDARTGGAIGWSPGTLRRRTGLWIDGGDGRCANLPVRSAFEAASAKDSRQNGVGLRQTRMAFSLM